MAIPRYCHKNIGYNEQADCINSFHTLLIKKKDEFSTQIIIRLNVIQKTHSFQSLSIDLVHIFLSFIQNVLDDKRYVNENCTIHIFPVVTVLLKEFTHRSWRYHSLRYYWQKLFDWYECRNNGQ